MMKCAACQAEIEANSLFCPKCGAKIEDQTDQATAEGAAAEPEDQPAAADEVVAETPPAEPEPEPTASERLLEVARSGGEQNADPDPGTEWTEGGYSPKALNARFLLTTLGSIFLAGFALWLTWGENGWGSWVWYPALIAIAGLWIWFVCIRIYRVWTIKYQLTAHQFYHEEGIFRRIRDVIEVIDIDDLKLERTLWDRLINGGVGTVIIKSTDVTDPRLMLIGLDDPDLVFTALDEARRKERAARGLKSV